MPSERPVSLCERCRHVRTIRSAKGSRFLLCELARARPELPKYPPQPVLRCAAFEAPASAVDAEAAEPPGEA